MYLLVIIILASVHCVHDGIGHSYKNTKIAKWKNQDFWDPKKRNRGSILTTVVMMFLIVTGIVLNEYPLFNIPKFATIIKLLIGFILYIAAYNLFWEYVLEDKSPKDNSNEKILDPVKSNP
jgi:divalent metal cation (Fe/Co/Zn/Cd) transporter